MQGNSKDSASSFQPGTEQAEGQKDGSTASVLVNKRVATSLSQHPQTDTERQSGNSCSDPRGCCHRTQMYLLMFLLSIGTYYAYDTPASLQKTIISVLEIDTTTYSLLYSIYSWPNIILSLCGSYLLNRIFGLRIGTFICSCLVCSGHFLFLLGAAFGNFTVMVLGRFVLGVGGEVLAVAQVTYTVMWFSGKHLPLFIGFLLSAGRTASGLSLGLNQNLYSHAFGSISSQNIRLGATLVIGLLFCIVALVAAGVLGLLDKRATRILCKQGDPKPTESFSLEYIKGFPFRLWVVFLLCVAYYIAVFPFIGLSQAFLVEKYELSAFIASLTISLAVYTVSSTLTSTMARVIEAVGYKLVWVTIGVVLSLIAHTMIAFLVSFASLVLALIILGVGYTFVSCSLWSLVALLLPKKQLGTAYAIMQALQNLVLAVAVLVGGGIADKSGYFSMEVFFIFCLCLALGAGITLHALDLGSDGKLNASACCACSKKTTSDEESGEKESLMKDESSDIEVPFHIRPLTFACTRIGVLK